MIFECTPAMADAVATIFRKEDIPYSHGLGPGCIAVEVDKRHEKRAATALQQWKTAVEYLAAQAVRK